METHGTFTIGEAFSYGWRMLKKNSGLLFLFSLIPATITAILGFLKLRHITEVALTPFVTCENLSCFFQMLYSELKHYADWRLLVGLLTFIVSAMVMTVAIRVALDIYYTGSSSFKRIGFIMTSFPWRIILTGFVFAALLIIGLMLAVIGCIAGMIIFKDSVVRFVFMLGLFISIAYAVYLAMRYALSFYYLIDKNAGIFESLSASYRMTHGVIWRLIGLVIVLAFAMLGLFLIGALIVHAPRYIFTALKINVPSAYDLIGLFVMSVYAYFLSWWHILSYAYVYAALSKPQEIQKTVNPPHFM